LTNSPRKTMAKSPNKPVKKSTNAVVAARVDEIFAIRLDGAQFHDIVQYAAEKGWNVEDRQLRTYISRADDLLVERQEKSRRRVMARHRAQRRALYARAINAADYRTALAVLSDEARLLNLYPATKIETKTDVSGKVQNVVEVVVTSREQADAVLALNKPGGV
jgi:hypothetical protein